METLEIFILGIVQGLTEFLPVSSSGHLVLFQHVFGMKEPQLLLDVCLHVGTLIAVFVVFFKELQRLASVLFRLPVLVRNAGGIVSLFQQNPDFRILVLIGFGTIPTAVLGLFFHTQIDLLFGTTRVAGIMLLVTGLLLFLTRRVTAPGRPVAAMTIRDALIIGLSQGMAILPGLSRSGTTISTALLLGVQRETAGPFSFLLSIPAIFGALLLQLSSSLTPSPVSLKMLLLSSATAAVTGFFALKILLRFVNQGRLSVFAPYCWVVGVLVLILTR